MKMARMFRGLLTLSCSLVVICVETIQSQIEYDLAANEIMVDPTTTTPPWPKLYLDDPSESPENPSVTFKPHRPPTSEPRAAPTPVPQVLENPENITEMITEPIRVYNDDTAQYVRYMLPYQNSEENTVIERSDATYRKPSKSHKPKKYRRRNWEKKPRKPVNLKESTVVSIPKIYVDMAFTGHYSKISVPMSRIRKSEKKVPGEVQLLLPKTALMPRSQSRMDSDLRPPATSGILTFPKQLIVDGVRNIKYASDRNDGGVWPFRMMRGVRNSVRSWTDGLFNLFRRRSFTPVMPTLPSFSLPFTSNNLDTLYRPEAWELDDPYTRKRKDRYHQQVVNLFDANRRNYKRMSSTDNELAVSGSEMKEVAKPIGIKRRHFNKRPNSELLVSATEVKPRVVKAKSNSNYDHSAWKPVARPHSATNRLEEQGERAVRERNYWKKIPQFLTSSNNTMDTFHWRSYPLLSNRRSDGKKVETGYWVPGSPGPLVWGDLLGKLETEQKKYQESFPIKLNITARDP